MPVRIRLSRVGAKKRPFYRIVVADSRRSRDGKFIDRIGSYNPMLPKDHPERVKINTEKAKDWIQKGAQPSNRVHLFLSNVGVLEKPIITEKTKKHLPRKKAQERAVALAAEKKSSEGDDKGKASGEESTNDKTSSENIKTPKENQEQKSEVSSVNTESIKSDKSNDSETKDKKKEEK